MVSRLMDTVTNYISALGRGFLGRISTWQHIFGLTANALAVALTPRFYANSATRSVVIKQIYFTAWQIIPEFTLFTALISFVLIEIVVSTAREFALSDYALEMTIRVLVMEVLPLLVAFFVALRSGAAINTEVALMNITNELQALERAGVDAMRFELIPRIIGGGVSVVSLTAIASSVALLIAYWVVYGFQFWGLTDFGQVLARIFTPFSIAVLWLKTLLFGIAVSVIPIVAGLQAPQKLFFAPIAVLQGMVRLFSVIMLVEVASLALRYI